MPQSSAANTREPAFLLTIDVEDWFQVENFKPFIPSATWPSRELRVEANTEVLLRLLDEARPGPAAGLSQEGPPVKATFFILGWLAERLPGLVRRIAGQGHEIASHGYRHDLNYQLPEQDLDQDLQTSKKLLEDIAGSPVRGYRAPTFSINNRILSRIKACGYSYDSSYNSVGLFKRSGALDLPRPGAGSLALRLSRNFYELPISNLPLGRTHLPWGGGGYFRIIPLALFQLGLRSIMRRTGGYCFYLHPWEIDPGQPRVREAPPLLRFRQYCNLQRTRPRLQSLLENFRNCRFLTCSEYLELLDNQNP